MLSASLSELELCHPPTRHPSSSSLCHGHTCTLCSSLATTAPRSINVLCCPPPSPRLCSPLPRRCLSTGHLPVPCLNLRSPLSRPHQVVHPPLPHRYQPLLPGPPVNLLLPIIPHTPRCIHPPFVYNVVITCYVLSRNPRGYTSVHYELETNRTR